jgi:hypothetical protein
MAGTEALDTINAIAGSDVRDVALVIGHTARLPLRSQHGRGVAWLERRRLTRSSHASTGGITRDRPAER